MNVLKGYCVCGRGPLLASCLGIGRVGFEERVQGLYKRYNAQTSSFRVCTFVVRAYVGKFAKRVRERDREGGRAQILSCLRGFGLYGWLLGVGGESGGFWGFLKS